MPTDSRDGATARPRCDNGVRLRCELPSDHEGDCKVNVMVNLDSMAAVNYHDALVEKCRALPIKWMRIFHEMSNAHFGGEGEHVANIYRLCADELLRALGDG